MNRSLVKSNRRNTKNVRNKKPPARSGRKTNKKNARAIVPIKPQQARATFNYDDEEAFYDRDKGPLYQTQVNNITNLNTLANDILSIYSKHPMWNADKLKGYGVGDLEDGQLVGLSGGELVSMSITSLTTNNNFFIAGAETDVISITSSTVTPRTFGPQKNKSAPTAIIDYKRALTEIELYANGSAQLKEITEADYSVNQTTTVVCSFIDMPQSGDKFVFTLDISASGNFLSGTGIKFRAPGQSI